MRVFLGCVLLAAALGGVSYGAARNRQADTPAAARAWHVLTNGVNAKKFAERILALKALSDLGPNGRGVRLVAAVLKDKDPDVRCRRRLRSAK
jgi:hypothetical protein